jgi:hypothetical protein
MAKINGSTDNFGYGRMWITFFLNANRKVKKVGFFGRDANKKGSLLREPLEVWMNNPYFINTIFFKSTKLPAVRR